MGRTRIAVFKPYNARHTTAFYGAQHTLFKYMQDRFDMDFTYFVDDPAVSFEGVRMTYLERSAVGTLLTGAYKLLGHPVNTAEIGFRKRTAPPRRLVSVGRLVREKGYDVIIDAVAEVAHAHQDITLDIFGRGPLEDALARRIRARRMESRIQLRGQVSREEVLKRLSDYDLLISHPLTMGHSAEAFLMANVEAMAAGLPVITSECGGVRTVVKDNAVVVAEADVRGLRAALERFLCGAEDIEARSVEGRAFVEKNYALDTTAAKWREVIETVVVRDRR